jgi:hypothetical protein
MNNKKGMCSSLSERTMNRSIPASLVVAVILIIIVTPHSGP